MIRVALSAEPIDPAALMARPTPVGTGATASFTGIARADDGVTTLEIEAYPAMAEAAFARHAQSAIDRWQLLGVDLVHRAGSVRPGEPVVHVAAHAAHRAPALEACAYLIDAVKSEAPLWKREWRGAAADWVAPREADAAALARWQTSAPD